MRVSMKMAEQSRAQIATSLLRDLLSSLGWQGKYYLCRRGKLYRANRQALPTAQYQTSLPSAYQLAVIGQDLPAVDVTSF